MSSVSCHLAFVSPRPHFLLLDDHRAGAFICGQGLPGEGFYPPTARKDRHPPITVWAHCRAKQTRALVGTLDATQAVPRCYSRTHGAIVGHRVVADSLTVRPVSSSCCGVTKIGVKLDCSGAGGSLPAGVPPLWRLPPPSGATLPPPLPLYH